MDKTRTKFLLLMLLFGIAIAVLFLVSFCVGSYPISVQTVFDVLRSKLSSVPTYWDGTVEKVVLQIRLPRIVLAILVGGGLSVSGASYQTLFQNPMVSPDILGVSAGAGFGAALAMLQNGSWEKIQLYALFFGLLAVALTYWIGLSYRKAEITTLVLSGIVVSSLFGALLSIVKTYADTDSQLPSITFWLMGSLGKGDMADVSVLLPVTLFCLLVLFLYRNRIDLLATGEEEAAALGIRVRWVSAVVILASTLLTVSAVSICGMIGWVGLVVPHIARLLCGAKYERLMLLSFFMGGFFLFAMDTIIRAVSEIELPLGVLTALVGTPVFAVLLMYSKRRDG